MSPSRLRWSTAPAACASSLHPTTPPRKTKDGADLAAQRQLADVIALGGGVPINVGNDTIGAVGVSGSSQTGDEACAKAGVAKVAEQLKTN